MDKKDDIFEGVEDDQENGRGSALSSAVAKFEDKPKFDLGKLPPILNESNEAMVPKNQIANLFQAKLKGGLVAMKEDELQRQQQEEKAKIVEDNIASQDVQKFKFKNGKELTEFQIKEVIRKSEMVLDFSVGNFIQFFLDTFLHLTIGPFALPLMLIYGKCNIPRLYNQFFIGTHSPAVPMFYMPAFMNIYVIFYCSYNLYMSYHFEDDDDQREYVPKIQWSEYVHYLVVLICRSVIIACKYAIYSDEHIQIIEETVLTQEIIASQLLAVNLFDTNIDNILTRVSIAMKTMNLKPNYFKLYMHYDQCQFGIPNYEKTLRRLQNYDDFKAQWNELYKSKVDFNETRVKCTRCIGECKLVKFENSEVKQIFGKELIETDLDLPKKIRGFLLQEKSDKVDGQNILLEMYCVSLKDTQDWAKGKQLRAMLIGVLQACFVPIWDSFKETQTNSKGESLEDGKYLAFKILSSMSCMMFYIANQILLISAIQIYRFKYDYQLQIQSMLDLKEAYFNETKTQNPLLVAHNPKNLAMFPQVQAVLKRLDQRLIYRAQMFAGAMFVIYSLIFAWIVVDVTIIGSKLIQPGRELFIIYAIFDISIILYYFLQMVNYGSQTNAMDHQFMIYFVRLRDDCIKLKLEAQQFGFYQSVQDPDKFVITDETIENNFLFVVNLENGQRHRKNELEDKSKYERVNEELLEKLEVYQETIEQVIEKIGFTLEYDQMEMLGITMDFDFIQNLFFLFLSFVVALIQSVTGTL